MSIFNSSSRLWALIVVSYAFSQTCFFLASFDFWFGNWVLFVLIPALTTFCYFRLTLDRVSSRSCGGGILFLLLGFFGYFTILVLAIFLAFVLAIGVGYIISSFGFSFAETNKDVESTQPLDGFSKFFVLVVYNYLAWAFGSLLFLFLRKLVPRMHRGS